MLRDELVAPNAIEVPSRTRFSRTFFILGRYKNAKKREVDLKVLPVGKGFVASDHIPCVGLNKKHRTSVRARKSELGVVAFLRVSSRPSAFFAFRSGSAFRSGFEVASHRLASLSVSNPAVRIAVLLVVSQGIGYFATAASYMRP